MQFRVALICLIFSAVLFAQARPSAQQEMPVRIGLVFSESGFSGLFSSHDAWLDSVLGWAGETLRRHKGDAFLVGFNDTVTSTQITADITQLRLALSQLRPLGRAALLDATLQSSEKLHAVRAEAQPTARILVIVADGHDNASSAKEREVIESAQRNNVRIYAIAWPSPKGTYGDKHLLDRLAAKTGGQAFFPKDQKELDRVLVEIEQDIAKLVGQPHS